MTPEQTAELRAAFAAHIANRLPAMSPGFRKWHDENIDLLNRIAAAAGNPNALTADLVHELVFEQSNGICRLNWGHLATRIRIYNNAHSRHPIPMPTPEAFIPSIARLLEIRNAGDRLSWADYLKFRDNFFEAAGLDNLASLVNRAVVAVFPDQFTTPVDDGSMFRAHAALARRGFVPHRSLESSWFECSSLVVRELRAVLAGNGFDDAYLSSFVWFAHKYFSERGEIRPQGR